MKDPNIKQLRTAISKYASPSTKKGLMFFIIDISIYLSSLAGVIFFESMVLKILCSILAGLKIASLFAIAHDAAHDSFTSIKLLNKTIARISFLPVLHNYSLWLLAHNRYHHQTPNVKSKNSWSPLSLDDYTSLPSWRKIIEIIYRHPAGIWLNYLIERWWKNKFIPFKSISEEFKAIQWLDLLLVVSYTTVFLLCLVYAGSKLENINVFGLIILAFILPIVIGSYVIGFTVYAQHTHESIPWFNRPEDCIQAGYSQEDLTIYMHFPHWYNLVSHNAMEHTVHHVDPRIPSYNLAKAQGIIVQLLDKKIVITNFSIKKFLETMTMCKLYDYENHNWLDFDGEITASTIMLEEQIKLSYAA